MRWRAAFLPRLTLSRQGLTLSLRIPGSRVRLTWRRRWPPVFARRVIRRSRRPT